MNATKRLSLIDTEAAPCTLDWKPGVGFCGGQRAQYTCSRAEFKSKCLKCGQARYVPVAFEGHKKVKGVEGFRAWLAKVDNA